MEVFLVYCLYHLTNHFHPWFQHRGLWIGCIWKYCECFVLWKWSYAMCTIAFILVCWVFSAKFWKKWGLSQLGKGKILWSLVIISTIPILPISHNKESRPTVYHMFTKRWCCLTNKVFMNQKTFVLIQIAQFWNFHLLLNTVIFIILSGIFCKIGN